MEEWEDLGVGRHGWFEHQGGERFIACTEAVQQREHTHLISNWTSDGGQAITQAFKRVEMIC